MKFVRCRLKISKEVDFGLTVGITGPSGAGKSTAVAVFKKRGFCVVDADKIARELTVPKSPMLSLLAERFGEDIINGDCSLNRGLLASRAFSSREQTDALNKIMHGQIRAEMLRRADDCAKRGVNCAFDAPQLFEAGLENDCDCILTVTAPREIRRERLLKRDCVSPTEIDKRMDRQKDDEYYARHSHYVIVNDKGVKELELATERVVNMILRNYSLAEN